MKLFNKISFFGLLTLVLAMGLILASCGDGKSDKIVGTTWIEQNTGLAMYFKNKTEVGFKDSDGEEGRTYTYVVNDNTFTMTNSAGYTWSGTIDGNEIIVDGQVFIKNKK
jgi:hypothetical protein